MDRSLSLTHSDFPGYIFQVIFRDNPAGIEVINQVFSIPHDSHNELTHGDSSNTQYEGRP